jgi:hypothetical protein
MPFLLLLGLLSLSILRIEARAAAKEERRRNQRP